MKDISTYLFHRLDLGLTDLEHQRPVGPSLWFAVWCSCAITLHPHPHQRGWRPQLSGAEQRHCSLLSIAQVHAPAKLLLTEVLTVSRVRSCVSAGGQFFGA